MFQKHVQETCQHEARVPIIVCRICHLKFLKSPQKQPLNSNEIQTTNGNVIQEKEMGAFRNDRNDSNPPQALVNYRSVIAHLYQKHVTLVYRCTSCPRAFAKKEAIYEHRVEVHDGNNSQGNLKRICCKSICYKNKTFF